MAKMQKNIRVFICKMLTADGKVIDFYRKAGFKKAGNTQPMWIYKGNEH